MSRHFSKQQCLDLVLKSPEAVGAHNKAAWLSIFARYNIVEDPVGSTAHLSGVYDAGMAQRGFGPLSRFYDTFIAPMQITFHVERDVVCGLSVVRDLTIEIQMSDRVTVYVPMHLLYELTDQQGVLKIQRLAAHWELAPMLRRQMAFGWAGLVVGNTAGLRMLKNLGLSGTINFMRALKTIGPRGKDRVEAFIGCLFGDEQALLALFHEGERFQVFLPSGEELDLGQLRQGKPTITTAKMLAAGNFITVSCCLALAGNNYSGVAFFEFNMRSGLIARVQWYLGE